MKKNKSKMEKVLDLLWKSQGTYIDIRNLTITPTQAKKVFQEVIQFLQMMGINYQAETSACRLRIVTEKENRLTEKTILFNQRYSNAVANLNGVID